MQKKKCSCIDKYIALKDIVTLLANAKEPYDAMDAQYIQSMIIPPIELNQFHIFYEDKKPVGFTTWSFLNKEAEKKLTNSCWHIDTVCNDISVLKVHRWTNNNLKKIIGAGKKVYWVRVNKDGSLRKLGWAKTR